MAVPRQRLNLLPQYARIAASLSTASLNVQGSLSYALAQELKSEFRSLCRRKVCLRCDLWLSIEFDGPCRLKNICTMFACETRGSLLNSPSSGQSLERHQHWLFRPSNSVLTTFLAPTSRHAQPCLRIVGGGWLPVLSMA